MQFNLTETCCAPPAWWELAIMFGVLFFFVFFIVFLCYQVAKYFLFKRKLRRMGDYGTKTLQERTKIYRRIWRLSWPLFFFVLGVSILVVAGIVVALFSPVFSENYAPLEDSLRRSRGFSFIALIFGFFTLCIWGVQQRMFDKFIGKLSSESTLLENEEK